MSEEKEEKSNIINNKDEFRKNEKNRNNYLYNNFIDKIYDKNKDKINEDKEKLKLEISKVFTKLRNSLNDREDELLTDIDKKYNDYFFADYLQIHN